VEGDQIKIEVLIDPDLISIANYTELFTTSEPWARYYVNDILLGIDASALNLFKYRYSNEYVNWTYLLPTNFLVGASNVSAFQHLYDIGQSYEFQNDTESYDLTLTNDLLFMRYEYHNDGILWAYEHRCYWDRVFEVSYNLQYGYLDKMEMYYKFKSGSIVHIFNLVILNEASTQKVGINWLSGMIPFLIFGLAIIYKRRKF
jgi:hypothetical protein